MKIVVNGMSANLRFSSAHIIPGHPFCGYIHGHSYFVDVEIEGEKSGDFNFVVDFKDVKNSARAVCKSLDHRLLIPIFNKFFNFKDINPEDLSLDYFNENFNDLNSIKFSVKDKKYSIPKTDCVLLPLAETSAEALSIYFTEIILNDLNTKGYKNIKSISVGVNEGIGQGAIYTKVIE
ncbi:MAG: 6-pyruvoyl tetrahydropterin synthase family protein [Methanobrevibacter sp.]|jgi:6-pyruvoyltetrahydropterin/6-carboxytetrahydropterin synthase|nr:6-pyruvoyl tetrahydropterin synthase family protein [Candidatus Methanoflexus mossambicus]